MQKKLKVVSQRQCQSLFLKNCGNSELMQGNVKPNVDVNFLRKSIDVYLEFIFEAAQINRMFSFKIHPTENELDKMI